MGRIWRAIVSFVLTPFMFFEEVFNPRERSDKSVVLFMLGIAIITLFLIATIVFVIFVRITVGLYVPFEWKQLPVAFGLLATGTVLYWFRCRRVGAYGLAEIALGLLLAVFVVNKEVQNTSLDLSGFFACAAALYIIVRGFDNIYRSINRRWIWNQIFFGQDTDTKL